MHASFIADDEVKIKKCWRGRRLEGRYDRRDAIRNEEIFFGRQRLYGDDDVVGVKQPLQLSHRGDMDDDALPPAARPPPFVCGFIYFSAVTSSAEA